MSGRFATQSEEPGTQPGSTVRIIRDTNTGQFYRVSHILAAFDTGKPETLVFECDDKGEVTNWTDIAGGSYMDLDAAVAELEEVLDGRKERDIMDSPGMEDGPLALVINTMREMSRLAGGDVDEEDEGDDWMVEESPWDFS